MKERKSTKDQICKELSFFFDQPEEKRQKLLQEAAYRLAHPRKTLEREARREKDERPRMRVLEVASRDMLEDCPGSGILDDGWLRVVLINRLGGLEIYRGARFKEAWLAREHRGFASLLGKHKWPRQGGLLRFATPFIREGHILHIDYDDEEQQYFFVIEEGPGISRTFWFPADFEASPIGTDWVRPRKLSLGSPWKETTKRVLPKFRRSVEGELTEDILRAYALGGKPRTDIILSLRTLYPELPAGVIKEQIEAKLKASRK